MRFMTYNIRHAQGIGGLVSNPRIAAVIARLDPTVVGLNEVWHIRRVFDQPHALARLLGMHAVFHEVHRGLPAMQGNMIMSRAHIERHQSFDLAGGIENRGLLVADLQVEGTVITFASTHLSLGRATRAVQIDRILALVEADRPLVVAGDLNAGPEELAALSERLSTLPDPPLTYPSWRPSKALDHIAWSPHWVLTGYGTMPSLASDHLPLYADLELAE